MFDVRYSMFGVKWLFLLFGLMQFSHAQTLDTLRARALSDTIKTVVSLDSLPKKKLKTPAQIAFRRSLMLPGAGQVYNKQTWLVPFIYVGAAASINFLSNFDKKYHKFKNAYIDAVEQNQTIAIEEGGQKYSAEQLRYAKNQARRYRDLNYIGLALGWGLQAVQANVQAHLRTFDSDNNISLKIKPVFDGSVAGLSVALGL